MSAAELLVLSGELTGEFCWLRVRTSAFLSEWKDWLYTDIFLRLSPSCASSSKHSSSESRPSSPS
eukprot:CAMPEP_0194735684 /NCGR_PEP_ID=MMETSP0296-20130528/74495_1 /TAXON_ID=39354 /ORGANISM="Heterosigma akashiwo, Strain CCMP2393" /LENGTH=64 /DNA_ID=CAMNT_0039644961 /DNA_START=344 /DNA_END=535 /DNA_ORIENTATION=-